MTMEMCQAAEEAFVERFLELGGDEEATASNCIVLQGLVQEYRVKACELAEQIKDGLAFNSSEAILTIQMLCFAKKYLRKLR